MALGVFCVHARFREIQKVKRMKMSLFSRRAPMLPGMRGIAVAAACCLFLAFSDNAPASSPAGKSPASAALSVARIPFVENHGQFGRDSVRFVARTFCGAVYVTESGELLYWLPKYEAAEADPGAAPGGMRIRQLAGSTMLRERFAGALVISPRAGREASGRVGYFKGDSSQWRADLPMIEEVELGQVYPGISLGLRAHGSSVEKVFTVAPGADPGQILVELEGAEGIEPDAMRKDLGKRFGIHLAGGQKSLQGRIFRIAHLGVIEPYQILGALACLEITLRAHGHGGFELGAGVAAAQAYFEGYQG